MRRLIILIILFALPIRAAWAAERYVVDVAASTLGFVYFLGDDPVKGRFPAFDADIEIDFESVSRSKIDVTLDASRATAGLIFATEAMLGESVLAADRFPKITFRSTNVRLGAHPTVIVAGDLTIRGTTRPITFNARLVVEDAAQMELRERFFVQLDGTFSRGAFGASGFPEMVGDEMRLEAQIAVIRAR